MKSLIHYLLFLVLGLLITIMIVSAQTSDPCTDAVNKKIQDDAGHYADVCQSHNEEEQNNAAEDIGSSPGVQRDCGGSDKGREKAEEALDDLCSALNGKCFCTVNVGYQTYHLWPGEYIEITFLHPPITPGGNAIPEEVRISCGSGSGEGGSKSARGSWNPEANRNDVDLNAGQDADVNKLTLGAPSPVGNFPTSGLTPTNVRRGGTPDKSRCFKAVGLPCREEDECEEDPDLTTSSGQTVGLRAPPVNPGVPIPELSTAAAVISLGIILLGIVFLRRRE